MFTVRWRSQVKYLGEELDVVSVTGNGGQLLIAIPALELLIGLTAGNFGDFRTWIQFRDKLVPERLLPAIDDL